MSMLYTSNDIDALLMSFEVKNFNTLVGTLQEKAF